MRKPLDGLYRGALWLAALCLLAIALLVGVQLAGRLLDGLLKLLGLAPYGLVILSLAEFAGFLLAAASFFALAATLKAGAHIRITLVLGMLSEGPRRWAEAAALAFAAVVSAYMTWQIGEFAFVSWRFNELSPGLIPVQLWIPQAAMTAGALVLTIALIDELVMVLRGKRPSFRNTEDAISLGKEG
ncbi:MAG TPA: TRAP transporter small permease subunit [Xanthobacteraceae bacterium]|nr:TRAP transporter small permease subunit [Xanthobacteraceae bacterium]